MNWSHVEQLLANCSKDAGFRETPNDRLRDYGEFLSRYDGAEGFVGVGQYLVLWSAEQIQELNAAYRVAEFAPGILLFGTDGGDTGFGIDEITGRYLSVPLIGLSRDAAKDEGSSFEEFLENRVAA
jgi:hypothetical protein